MYGELKCTCRDENRPKDVSVVARPISPPSKINGQCKTYARLVLHLDLAPQGRVVIRRREQFVDKDDSNKDFNDMGGYELCHGKELTPPISSDHCSAGGRLSSTGPCMTRLEQLTYDEAQKSCRERGGRLAKIRTVEEAEALQQIGGRKNLGIGLRDFGADDDWRFDDGTNATAAVNSFQQLFSSKESSHRRRRRAGNEFRRHGCIFVAGSGRTLLQPMDCSIKMDWACEGTLANPPIGEPRVQGDLKADEGAFCLWHAHEPLDLLPNDEGKNFRNTDLQCHLQTSSRQRRQCKFNPESRRRGLVTQRGDRHNGLNYPVQGSTIGWTGSKANMTFLNIKNSDDDFHCHYSPNNNGLLRVYAMQHMFDRNYIGSMRMTCGCGYKHLSQLVSRCDCTRSGRADNNCAKWHRAQLIEATNDTHPVRCNNCNANDIM
jgi:hypothetical protein